MSNQVVICGLHAVKSAIEAAPAEVVRLWIDRKRHDKRMQSILDLAKRHSLPLEFLGRDELDAKAEGQVHQGVVLMTRAGKSYSEKDLDDLLADAKSPPLVLVLDGVTDPHNLGACLRTADAAGVDLVVVPKDRAAGLTATARKSASGAAERLPFIQVTNLARTLKQLQDAGLWITGTAMQGEALYQADLTGPRVIVMGSEGKGMRRLTQEHCDQLVNIPMQGHVESLNVSVATGVVLYEVVRQRRSGGTT
ncbi:MAG: 23S rRNA (guanosine(2251)-2'-O)-methyltransferase RlmB [Gammaproteobacteria bacterium]|nr:23S rRNA (guanosine(2251)-2'-O)-methyltransferase RlmB [Gammaproteobacteria bacterium]